MFYLFFPTFGNIFFFNHSVLLGNIEIRQAILFHFAVKISPFYVSLVGSKPFPSPVHVPVPVQVPIQGNQQVAVPLATRQMVTPQMISQSQVSRPQMIGQPQVPAAQVNSQSQVPSSRVTKVVQVVDNGRNAVINFVYKY